MKTKNAVLQQSFDFALKLIDYCELIETQRKFVIARQLLRSGTSIGANVCEAQNAESSRDFFHKLKIAAKEVEETIFWLSLCKTSAKYPDPEKLTEQIIEIRKILSSILATCKRKQLA